MSIRKHYKSKTQISNSNNNISSNINEPKTSGFQLSSQKSRYRSISTNISIVFKISQLMKLANNQRDRYNDNIFELKVNSLGMKLCYIDVEHLKSVFVKS